MTALSLFAGSSNDMLVLINEMAPFSFFIPRTVGRKSQLSSLAVLLTASRISGTEAKRSAVLASSALALLMNLQRRRGRRRKREGQGKNDLTGASSLMDWRMTQTVRRLSGGICWDQESNRKFGRPWYNFIPLDELHRNSLTAFNGHRLQILDLRSYITILIMHHSTGRPTRDAGTVPLDDPLSWHCKYMNCMYCKCHTADAATWRIIMLLDGHV